MPARTWTLEDRLKTIPTIFDQVQNTTANHSKNYVALFKVHQEAAKVTESVNDGEGIRLIGERAFEDALIDIINRVLVVKKGESVADRVVKFVGGYLKFGNEKVAEIKSKEGEDEDDESSSIARLAARITRHLLKGCLAKDKVIRYRCVQLLAEVMAHMDEIDDELYSTLRTHLIERVRDKESIIRVQAVVGLSKLAGSEDPADLEDDEISIIETLVLILRHDTSPEVRRAALLSIPPSPKTVKTLLSRTRDVDAGVRKLLYANVLYETLHHPKQLSIAQRERIVRDGLGDRDPNVRNAAGKLVASWLDTLDGSLEHFLRIFDLVGEPESMSVAEDALKSVFQSRPDIMDSCDFNEEYWADPSPSKTFLARVFVDYCISTKDISSQETALPVVTFLAFKIQSSYNALLERIQELSENRPQAMQNDDDDDEEIDDKQEELEFVIGEMLKLAVHLDYADEIGRRKMFGLVREMISQEALPQSLVNKCLDVMRNLASGERDLIRVIVEVIQELRDTGEAEKEEEIPHDTATTQMSDSPRTVRTRKETPARELTDEELRRSSIVDLRCLDLCHGMLERVNGTFEENSTLEGVLADLIVPSVKRKEFALREKGLICLGLCCLIAKRMALNSFQLFMSQIQTAPEPLKLPVLKVVFDILMVHGREFLYSENAAIPPERITEFLLYLLQNEEAESVQGVLIVGISKLMLSGLIHDERVLKSLVASFFSPDLAQNQQVRQCLSYFFPAYCYSSSSNQAQMQNIAIPILQLLFGLYREVESDDAIMVAPSQMALLMVDWTDPQKSIEIRGVQVEHSIHIDLATSIVHVLLTQPLHGELQKILVGLLGKLYLPSDCEKQRLYKLKLYLDALVKKRPRKDTTSKNALSRFVKAFEKKYAEELETLDEDKLRPLEEFAAVFQTVEKIDSEEGELIELPPPIKKRVPKSRSTSVSTQVTQEDSGDDGKPRQPVRRQPLRTPKVQRQRAIVEEDENDEEEEDESTESEPSTPTRPPAKKGQSRNPPKNRKPPSPPASDVESDPETRSVAATEDDEEDEVDELL